ncbi:hypothetical protein C0J52_10711 [Blattella germanica]|nr:hypothetical protein C0J52_10711 [Blattella germanica]
MSCNRTYLEENDYYAMMENSTDNISFESLSFPDENLNSGLSDDNLMHIFDDPQDEQHVAETNYNDLENQINNVVQNSEDSIDCGSRSHQYEVPNLKPQEKLLWALQNDKLEDFITLLQHPEVNAQFKYTKLQGNPDVPSYRPIFGTCIEIASRLHNRGQYVKALLDHGVKPNVNEVCPEPIHYAAEKGNPDALKELLQDKRTKVNVVNSSGRTALHLAVLYDKPGREEKYDQCIVMLLERHDLDINKPNSNGYTAIHEAANLQNLSMGKKVVELFLKYRIFDLDLDKHIGKGRTARDVINMKYPELKGLLPDLKRQKAYDINSQLLVALQNEQLRIFKKLLRQVDSDGNARIDPNYVYENPHNATCLQIACKDDKYADYVKELLNAGSDPNIKDPITGQAPLHIAAILENVKVLSKLLECTRTNVNILDKDNNTAAEIALNNDSEKVLNIMVNFAGKRMNVDAKESTRKTLREIICAKYPDLGNQLQEIQGNVPKVDICMKLFQCLYDKKTREFIEEIEKQSEIDNFEDGNYTLLQYAVYHCMKDEVKALLNGGVNPNKKTKNKKLPPIIIATMHKHNEVLSILLELNPYGRLDINGIDAKGNTSLHYAAKKGDLECVVKLLQHGADFRHKNIFGKPPLPADDVEIFFDNSVKPNEKYPEDDDYELIFDYSFLLAQKKQTFEKYHLELEQTRKDPETTSSLLPAHNEQQSQEDTRLELNTNEESHQLSLGTPKPEMDFLFYISSSKEHRKLMAHPIVTSFLNIKWNSVKFLFIMNLVIYFIFIILLNTYILLKVGENEQTQSNNIQGIFEKFAMTCIPMFLIYFLLEEFLKCSLSPHAYIKNFESYINFGLIIFTAWMLLQWKTFIVVASILLSWTKLLLLTGRLPKLSKNIEMLKTVCRNYCWFLFSYIFLILAFAFCFYSILHGDAIKEKNNNTTENKTKHDKDDHYGFFMNPLLSIEKTFIMMMGEFEAKDLLSNMESFHTCFWLFSLFVFIMSMILLNLLTGLAVNDTQTIKANAEQLSLISRIRLIYEIENICFEWYRFLERWHMYK